MSKKWKVAAANLFIRMFNRCCGKLKPLAQYRTDLQFDSIVIYSTTALGDFMFNTPVIRALKQRFPAARLTLVSSVKNESLVKDCAYFSKVVYWDQKFNDVVRVSREIKQQRPQLAVLLHCKPPYDILTAVMAGCEFIIRDNYGAEAQGMECWLADYSGSFSGHLIQRKLQLISRLGCDTADCSMFVPAPFTPILRPAGQVTIGFQMGASEPLRCWPTERFAELARQLLAAGSHYHIALIGSPRERHLVDAFMQQLAIDAPDLLRVHDYVGKSDLPGLLALIDSFDVLVTGDTGPLHLAVALQTRTVSLFATANPAYTGPLQDPQLHQVIRIHIGDYQLTEQQKHQPLCVISAHTVFDKIQQQLAELS